MEIDIFKLDDPTGKFYKEKYLYAKHPEEYRLVVDFSEQNGFSHIPFKEKVYLYVNKISYIPVCKNPECNNSVKYRNSTLGYREYCSTKCVSTDPSVKKLKEEKSIRNFGTKTPAESDKIKSKIITTNLERYGGNSPMSSEKTRDKSKKTLFENWGVENPSRNSEILEKRIQSFKSGSYKESFRKSSLEKYGVEHPWMVREIHSKTTEHFYSEYSKRIDSKIEGKDVVFLGFDKSKSTKLMFGCGTCQKDFEILTYQFYHRINAKNPICTSCYPISENSSIDQIELYNFIREIYQGEVVQNQKNVIGPYEIDIYLPELKIGFEFNGTFWHSDKFKDSEYHLRKQEKASDSGIKMYTVWEDDWTLKREICKSFVSNKIGKTSRKIHARKCSVTEIGYPESKKFLDENHLQGDCKSSIRIGLFHEKEMVSLMTFSKLRLPLSSKNTPGTYELTRFCNLIDCSVVGGASKILKYFLKTYNPEKVETYSDNLISEGNMYLKLGFEYSHTSRPGYWYLIDGIRHHRFNWRKSRLVKMGYDKNKTEEEIMMENGHYRVYNSGNRKWVLNLKS